MMENLIPIATTENMDKAYVVSGNYCLDFFTRITRGASIGDYLDAFTKAWAENKEIAFKILINMRDIRSGKGEKLIPCVLFVYLKLCLPSDVYQDLLQKLVEYGCWKDILRIIDIYTRSMLSKHKKAIRNINFEIKLFADQLQKDMQILSECEADDSNEKKAAISLCAKWAPSEYSHYDHHPLYFARAISVQMGLTFPQYRKLLTKLRKHLCILETLMSTQKFDQIDFSKIPSVALMKTKHAFMRDSNSSGKESEHRQKLHQSYSEYLKKLTEGKTKVNIKGIQPHELVQTYLHKNSEIDLLTEAQWTELKKRVELSGAFKDVTAVVDVSGSMSGQPMLVSIALGILVAECTIIGPFHGKVLTFDEEPSWHQLIGSNLKEKVDCMSSMSWGGSTNMRAVFDLILTDAINAKLPVEQMVKTLFIFTDMQFNGSVDNVWESTFEYAKQSYKQAGYKLPNIICWNLRTSNSKTMPVTQNEDGFVMLSGFSAELLKCILNAKEFTPLSMMMHILEPYETPDSLIQCNINNLFCLLEHKILEEGILKCAIRKAFIKDGKQVLVPTNTKEVPPSSPVEYL